MARKNSPQDSIFKKSIPKLAAIALVITSAPAHAQLAPPIPTPLPPPTPDNPAGEVVSPDSVRVGITNIVSIIESQIISSISRSIAGPRARRLRTAFADRTPSVVYKQYASAAGDAIDEQEAAPLPAREDVESVVGLWGSTAMSWLDNERSGAEFDGHLLTPLIGIDRLETPRGLIYGLSLGYERVDLDTAPNRGTYRANGFTVAPYLGLRLSDSFLIDAGAGYTRVSYDQDRQGAVGTVSGSFNGDRLFGFASLTGLAPQSWLPSEAFSLTGTLGFLFAWEQQDSFRESDGTPIDDTTTRLGQLRLGGRASYYAEPKGIGLESFLSGTFNYDAVRTDQAVLIGRAPPSKDRTDFVLTIGFNADFTDALSGNIEFSNTFAREDFSNQTLLVGLKYVF